MNRPLALDLFCGAGGAAVGLHRAGFDLHGVDIEPQPSYPFRFTLLNAFEAVEFPCDFIWASPPCQAYTTLRTRHNKNYPDYIDELRDLLELTDLPWVIENVIGAPLRDPIILDGRMFGLKVVRRRAFESNIPLRVPDRPIDKKSGPGSHRWPYKPKNGFVMVTGTGGNYKFDEGCRAMGIDWMKNKTELSQAIPPAYSEWIGQQIMEKMGFPR